MIKANLCEPSNFTVMEMSRLYRAGFSLIPLGAGQDGKSPMTRFSGKLRLPLKQVLGPMHSKGSACYGIRTDKLAVLDCDTNDLNLIGELEARFGGAKVHIRTPRGWHLYFSTGETSRINLRDEGLPVDFKNGANSYVVGPHSIRPDGGLYAPTKGILGESALSVLGHVIAPAYSKIGVPEGSRNEMLTKRSVAMVEYVVGVDELFENLKYVRDEECCYPETIGDAEVEKIAQWAWGLRLNNCIYKGRDSEFRLNRQTLNLLKEVPNTTDCISLYVILKDLHGHRLGYHFALKHAAMRMAKHTDLSRERFVKARNSLLAVGLLRVASSYKVGSQPKSYRLSIPVSNSSQVVALG